ncbi:hypothetical protein BC332_30301 [Capsicum chinense]|nr:hypothetical protein BC332_30301 [Capsicum chinense]
MNHGLVEAVYLGDDAGVVASIGGGRLVVAGSGEDGRRDAGKEVVIAGSSEEALEAKEVGDACSWLVSDVDGVRQPWLPSFEREKEYLRKGDGRERKRLVVGIKFRDSSQSYRSIHSTSHSDPTNEDSSQAAPTNQAALKKYSRHKSNMHWVVDAIDSRNNVKKIKVNAKEVMNLTGKERIMAKFDIYDEPFGEARNLLSRFYGILACDCSLFSINFEKWSNLPMTYFNRVFDHIIKLGGKIGIAGSPLTRSNQNEYMERKIGQPYAEDFLQGSDTCSSNAMAEDSSESALQILLDFPSNNDMSFLGHSDSYSLYPFLSESY